MKAEPPSRSRARRTLAVGGPLLVLVLAGGAGAIWLERNAIGVRLATDYLRARGVPARIRITHLGADGFTAKVSLGPPEHPDLEIETVKGAFAPIFTPGRPFGAAPKLTSLTLVRPKLRAEWDGRRLRMGVLDRLIQGGGGGAGGALPDVEVTEGQFDLQTPAGHLLVQGDAHLPKGHLASADLKLAPTDLALGNRRARRLWASARVTTAGSRMHATGSAASSQLETEAVAAEAATARFDADVPVSTGGAIEGPLSATLDLTSQRLAGAGKLRGNANALATHLALSGAWSQSARTYRGKVALQVRAEQAEGAGGSARWPQLSLQSPDLQATLAQPGVRASGPVRIDARLGASTIPGQQFRIDQAATNAAGRFAYDGGVVTTDLQASASGRGGVAPAATRRLGAQLDVLAPTAKRGQLAKGLTQIALAAPALHLAANRNGDIQLDFPRPLELRAGAAAQARLTSRGLLRDHRGGLAGALDLSLDGPAVPKAHLVADHIAADTHGRRIAAALRLDLTGDVATLHGLDLHWSGTTGSNDGVVTASQNGCAPLRIATLVDPHEKPSLSGIAATLCPSPKALLLRWDHGGWRLAVAARDVSAEAPAAEVRLEHASADLDLDGRAKGGIGGRVALPGLDLVDLASVTRVKPLHLSGEVASHGDAWSGAISLALREGGASLGRATVDYDHAGVGALHWRAPDLRFAKGGLQPGDALPLLARYASEAQGPLNASLDLGWSSAGLTTSQLTLSTGDLDLRTPAGRLTGLSGDATFSPLVPLASQGVQHLHAQRLETLLPLTGLSLDAVLDPNGLVVKQASAAVAGGRAEVADFHVPFTPGATLTPVVQLQGVQLAEVLTSFNLANAVSAQAALSGVIPLSIGPQGLRIANGELAADGPGRLTLHRQALAGVGATAGPPPAPGAPPTVAPAPSAMQDLAYQALEDLAFDDLSAAVDSRPGGRLGVVLHVKGRHDPPIAPPPPRIGLLDLLRGKAFDKQLPLPKATPIDLTLDTSLNFDDLLADYGRLGHGATAAGSPPVQR